MFKPLFTSGSLFLKGVDILLENLFKLKENGTNAKTEMMRLYIEGNMTAKDAK